MIKVIFDIVVYTPLYNGLVFLIDYIPYADLGIAVILLTLIVKIILFPLAYKVSHMQAKMKELAPKIESLKEEHRNDKQKQTIKTMELYKEHNVRPFLSILIVFIQFPIIIGLYFVFSHGGLPKIDSTLLYSFVRIPDVISMKFLWIPDLAGRSIILALLVGIAQFIQIKYTLPKAKPRGENPTLKDDLAHSFQLQMKYFMPILIAGVSYYISAAVALYLLTSTLFAIGQEMIVKHQQKNNLLKKEYATTRN